MYRVTTPTIVIQIDDDTFDMSSIDICHIAIANNSGRNLKIFNPTDIDTVKRIIYLDLSQEDTKLYETGDIDIQLKIKLNNGKVVPSEIMRTTMQRIMEEDIL